jgi:hypothetical protein
MKTVLFCGRRFSCFEKYIDNSCRFVQEVLNLNHGSIGWFLLVRAAVGVVAARCAQGGVDMQRNEETWQAIKMAERWWVVGCFDHVVLSSAVLRHKCTTIYTHWSANSSDGGEAKGERKKERKKNRREAETDQVAFFLLGYHHH